MNPYAPPVTATQKLTTIPSTAIQILRMGIRWVGSAIFTLFVWALTLVFFFGNSGDYWPGFACLVPATAAGFAIGFFARQWNPKTPLLLLFYLALDLFLLVTLVSYLMYWRMYLYQLPN